MDQSPMSAGANGMSKFPAFSPDYMPRGSHDGQWKDDLALDHDSSPRPPSDNWAPKRYNNRFGRWSTTNGNAYNDIRHGRQKSLSEAIRTIRTRNGSISQNALEIADALKAPVSPALVFLFSIWYFASVMSSTSSKVILKSFPKPVTLTVLQFAFVSAWCLFISYISARFPIIRRRIPALKNGIKYPTRDVIVTTLPITAFMIGGHILSSHAISRIDVSLVHTIKGLSPLITVAAYRIFFDRRYSVETYLSLIPLTIGVILACSTNFSANFLGLLSAFASAILFVTQNMVSKEIFNAAALAESEPRLTRKPDKLNLLCYSSLLALAFTAPIWLWSEGWHILVDFFSDASITLTESKGSLDHGPLLMEYIFNGTFHFLQSLTAFQLLSMVSPVTYSVASLVKRVFVIVFSIVWFGSAVTRIQYFGIALTFLGLYLYDRTSDASKVDRRGTRHQPGHISTQPLLPLVEKSHESPPPLQTRFPPRTPLFGSGVAHSPPLENDHGRVSPVPRDPPDGKTNGWLPAGTKAEDTWKQKDIAIGVS